MISRPIRHRRVRRTDFAAVHALLDACGLPVPAADRAGLRRFRRVVADLGADLYVATVDERVAGIVHVTYRRDLRHGQQAQLVLLAVAPADRGHGVGRALAAWAMARARRRGCTRLECTPGAAADAAAAFLTALGWQTAGPRFAIDLAGGAE